METKVSKAKQLFISGKLKDALRIFKTFNRDFDKQQQKIITIAYESMSGHASFYRQLSIDTDSMISEAQRIIKATYNL